MTELPDWFTELAECLEAIFRGWSSCLSFFTGGEFHPICTAYFQTQENHFDILTNLPLLKEKILRFYEFDELEIQLLGKAEDRLLLQLDIKDRGKVYRAVKFSVIQCFGSCTYRLTYQT